MVFHTSIFYELAKEYVEATEPTEDRIIALNDITTEFYKEIENMLKFRDAINININARVRSGKSTVAIAIGKYINQKMRELNITNKKFTIWNIARSQFELSKKMRDPNLDNTIIVIDEYDDMEDTGENTTVEQGLLRHYSKIQAGRYIHRIYCSPSDMPDDQSEIIINVIQSNKQTMETHCRVYYRYLKGTYKVDQLIGTVNIDVSNIIKNWIENGVETLFYKKNKTQQEKDTINTIRKKDFYAEYMCRKFEKMDMLNKHGIFRTKRLDYADLILDIVTELQPITKIGGINTKLIKSIVKAKCRENKVPQSILGEQLMTDEVDSILASWTTYYEQIQKLKKAKQQVTQNKISKEDFETHYTERQKAILKLRDVIEKEMTELGFLKSIKEKYYKEEI